MHIVFSSYDDINNPFYGGGGAKAIHEVGKRLIKKNKVTVITANYKGAKHGLVDGIEYKRIGPEKASARLGQIIYQILLPFYCRFNDFDVWIESFTPPISTAFLPLITKKPVIGLAQLLAGSDMEKKYNLPFKAIENFGLRFYKMCIVLTSEEKEKISIRFPKMQVFVIPNGISEWPNWQLKEIEKSTLLFLGRLDIHQKGIDLLFEAWKILDRHNKKKLIIAGNGSKKEIEQVNEMVKQIGDNSIEYVGQISGKNKFDVLQKSKAMVISSRFESFGITALEAMQFGKPLIAFDIPGLEWIPKKFKCIAKSYEAESLARAIKKCLEMKVDNDYIYESREFAQRFTWDKISKEYETIFTKLIA